MKKLFSINLNGIVENVYYSKTDVDGTIECPKEYEFTNIIGLRWTGSTFEEVPTEEVEPTGDTEVTNGDLLEVLLAIGEKVGA